MPFRLAVHQDEIRPDSPIGSQNNGAIPRAFWGLNTFGEVNFSGLNVGHWDYLRFNSVSRQVSQFTTYL